MTTQLQLFKLQSVNLKQYREEIKSNPDADRLLEIYREVTQQSVEPYVVLNFIIEVLIQLDATVLWDQFEKKGRMVYFDFTIGKTSFCCVEKDDMEIRLNDVLVFAWGENDQFTKETMTRIKKKIKGFVARRSQQFHWLILNENSGS